MLQGRIEWDIEPVEVSENFDEFQRVLASELEEALEDVVDTVGSEAQANAPVDTGRLRDEISWQVERIAEALIEGQIESGAPYSAFVEFGTIYMEPNSFMSPALDGNRDWIVQRVETAIENAIQRVFG